MNIDVCSIVIIVFSILNVHLLYSSVTLIRVVGLFTSIVSLA